jgi:Cu2+-containing amine oxidase
MEDWPVMPTHWKSFVLMPFNFFAYNPAIDTAVEGNAILPAQKPR